MTQVPSASGPTTTSLAPAIEAPDPETLSRQLVEAFPQRKNEDRAHRDGLLNQVMQYIEFLPTDIRAEAVVRYCHKGGFLGAKELHEAAVTVLRNEFERCYPRSTTAGMDRGTYGRIMERDVWRADMTYDHQYERDAERYIDDRLYRREPPAWQQIIEKQAAQIATQRDRIKTLEWRLIDADTTYTRR